MLTEEIEIHTKQKRQSKVIGNFVRQHDRMQFKQEPVDEVKRKYVNGVPLLMDLSKYDSSCLNAPLYR